jgi:predicted RNase H-like HicB family nuclease
MAIYPATMKKDHPEGIFVIEFPDFEEAMVAGRLGKDDPQNIGRKCLFDTIWFRLEEGRPIPAPSELCAGQLAISLDNFTVNDNKIIKDAVLDSFVKTFDESVKKFIQQGAHVNNMPYFPRASKGGNRETILNPEKHEARIWQIISMIIQHYNKISNRDVDSITINF